MVSEVYLLHTTGRSIWGSWQPSHLDRQNPQQGQRGLNQ
jgi:hypothetical protein